MVKLYLRILDQDDLDEIDQDGKIMQLRLLGMTLKECVSEIELEGASRKIDQWNHLPGADVAKRRDRYRTFLVNLRSLRKEALDYLLLKDRAQAIRTLVVAETLSAVSDESLSSVENYLEGLKNGH